MYMLAFSGRIRGVTAGEGVRGPLYTCVYCHYTQGNRYKSKAHIPPEIGFAWGTNANEIYTKNMKYTWPTPAFCVGTQCQLYSTDWRRGLASGKTQLLGFASGKTRKMCVTQRQRYQHVGIFCVR